MGKQSLAAGVAVGILMLCLQSAHGGEWIEEILSTGKLKISHLQFYFHDKVTGSNVTAVEVASAPISKSSPTGFSSVAVIDDLLTEGPEQTSKEVGRAQGIYVSSCIRDLHLLMAMTVVFESGQFNGSTLSIAGKNAVLDDVRELPIVGGTGQFRLARGFALLHTHSLSAPNAVVFYNVTVIHY
eukprot:Gb_01814 [translate_table: standard]